MQFTVETFDASGEPRAVWMYEWDSLEACKREAREIHRSERSALTVIWDGWLSGAARLLTIDSRPTPARLRRSRRAA